MTDLTKLDAIAKALKTVPGVHKANVWTKVSGKERVYIDLAKFEGEKTVTGGVAYFDPKTNDLRLDMNRGWKSESVAAWHGKNETFNQMRRVIDRVLSGEVAVEVNPHDAFPCEMYPALTETPEWAASDDDIF
jgi:hypothetical protein